MQPLLDGDGICPADFPPEWFGLLIEPGSSSGGLLLAFELAQLAQGGVGPVREISAKCKNSRLRQRTFLWPDGLDKEGLEKNSQPPILHYRNQSFRKLSAVQVALHHVSERVRVRAGRQGPVRPEPQGKSQTDNRSSCS